MSVFVLPVLLCAAFAFVFVDVRVLDLLGATMVKLLQRVVH